MIASTGSNTEESFFDLEALAKEMVAAARATLAQRGPGLREMGEAEIRRLAGVLADIASKLITGELDPDRAKVLVNIHQLTVESVLRSVEGLGILATRDALKAVTRVAGAVVNRALGFKLL